MAFDRQQRRLTLRDLLIDGEKRTRDIIGIVGTTWLSRVTDLRDLSRTHRRRSPYPTLVALKNSVEKVMAMQNEMTELIEYLLHELDEIRDHARRERLNRR
jgi:hypothetical protein